LILFYLEYFSENVNLIKQKIIQTFNRHLIDNYEHLINIKILKYIINFHNYQLNVYYNYNDNKLYIYIYNYIINRYYIFKIYYLC